MQVQQIVCPRCARKHGLPHAAGCPDDIPEASAAYGAGWDAARDAFGLLARWAKEDQAKIIAEGLRSLADGLEKM